VELHATAHHATISCSDLSASVQFYGRFGFEKVYEHVDESVTIAHLGLPDGFILEIFAFTGNVGRPLLDASVGNDLEDRGVKHLALEVADIRDAHAQCEAHGLTPTEIRRGRTEIDYFFVRDPDGIWLELVQDDRRLRR
jgi:catechol 2,3-dioxygenase-like lactoylglutathione lyase family enzyme